MAITPISFSGGTANGRGIKVAAAATPGTLIHASSGVLNVLDEVWLYVENTDSQTRRVTIEWGGTTSPDDTINQDIPPGLGAFVVIPGWRLGGPAAVLNIRAFCAAAANVLIVTGNVNRYTP